jgi:hypothetical protein
MSDTLVLLASADQAKLAENAAKSEVLKHFKSGYLQHTVPLGDGGVYFSGKTTDGSQSLTVVLFSEGKVLASLSFSSAANDPLPIALAKQISVKQDAKIKNNPPS